MRAAMTGECRQKEGRSAEGFRMEIGNGWAARSVGEKNGGVA
jgi:hypothetical protein